MKTRWNGELVWGALLCTLITGMALISLVYLPYDYNGIDSAHRFAPAGPQHLFGTDNLGRDVFSRIMAGSRYTLLLALLTVTGSAAIGSLLGLAAGFAGGVPDEVTMRLMDALSSFPGILLALVMVALMGNGEGSLFIALLVLFIPSFVRIVRSGTLQYKTKDFVLMAQIMGASRFRILFLHILPNLIPSLLSASVLGLSNAILAEA
ncbi:MAG: ABC transporter permease, partial [Treponema sp.]|nr:ABC transporter permease [Treponema sp.]